MIRVKHVFYYEWLITIQLQNFNFDLIQNARVFGEVVISQGYSWCLSPNFITVDYICYSLIHRFIFIWNKVLRIANNLHWVRCCLFLHRSDSTYYNLPLLSFMKCFGQIITSMSIFSFNIWNSSKFTCDVALSYS